MSAWSKMGRSTSEGSRAGCSRTDRTWDEVFCKRRRAGNEVGDRHSRVKTSTGPYAAKLRNAWQGRRIPSAARISTTVVSFAVVYTAITSTTVTITPTAWKPAWPTLSQISRNTPTHPIAIPRDKVTHPRHILDKSVALTFHKILASCSKVGEAFDMEEIALYVVGYRRKKAA